MTYRRIEQIVLAFGALALLASVIAFAPRGVPSTSDLLGQALLFGVLLAAVRYGRRGGMLAAVAASVLYTVAHLPMLRTAEVGSAQLLAVGLRIAIFGAVGIVGGEVFMRLRYQLATLEGSSALDEWSRVYNERYLHAALEQAIERHERYAEPVSLVVIGLPTLATKGLSPARQRALVRGVADLLRGNVRTVDEVARLNDGRFTILLPHTPGSGGIVVAERLVGHLARHLSVSADAVMARVVSLPDDATGIAEFRDSIESASLDYEAAVSGT
jgi:GGDEF domain-containing protein